MRAAQSTDAGAKPSNQQNNRDSSGNRKKPQNTGDIHIRIHLDETSLSPKGKLQTNAEARRSGVSIPPCFYRSSCT